MSHENVRKLIENATVFAKCYTRLVEALVAEGVEEATARTEARQAALLAAIMDEETEGAPWEG